MKAQLSSKQCKELGYDFKLGGTLTENKPKRTLAQNVAIWARCRSLGDAVGLTPEELYTEIACEMFGYELTTFRGVARKRALKRPSKSNREECSQMIDILDRWEAEYGQGASRN